MLPLASERPLQPAQSEQDTWTASRVSKIAGPAQTCVGIATASSYPLAAHNPTNVADSVYGPASGENIDDIISFDEFINRVDWYSADPFFVQASGV